MKYLLTILIGISLITFGCDKKSTDSDNKDQIFSYTTINVKTNTEYFNFANNTGYSNQNSNYDVEFYSELYQPPGMPFPISDPRFKVKDGLSAAVIDVESLDDIVEVPANSEFITKFVSENGEWYDTNDGLILPYDKVYVVNTNDGKFPAFEIINYYAEVDNEVVSGYYTIEWKYLSE